MCYVQSLPDVWKPNIKAKKEFGPSSVSIMPEVDFTSTPGAWSASVSRQRCQRLWHHQRSYLLRHIQQYLLGYDINRNLRSSVFDQVVILRVKSEIPFVKSGIASLALQGIFISIFDASLAIWPCVSKSLSTNEPSGKNGVEAVFNVQPLNSSYALQTFSAKSSTLNCIAVSVIFPRIRSTGVGSSISMCFLTYPKKVCVDLLGRVIPCRPRTKSTKVQCLS